ncbi:hypothetical protein [Meiothermus cerbereus]|jgi:hypothetical protein|uniref:hypothetical protein n=1 Tax=Meiothermus cerbereus TaxID=65552 RepID=UPI00047F5CD6|nr:hypothetical protein [Meiothermus cerbereus]
MNWELRGRLLRLFFTQQDWILAVGRAKRSMPEFAARLKAAEKEAVARGVPLPFVFHAALRRYPQPQPALVRGYLSAVEASNRLLWEAIQTGWPGRRVVGAAGAFAAAVLLAHADDDPLLRQAALRPMRVAVEKREADPRAYAHIVDRARAFEGRPTLFATFGLGGLGEWPSEALEVVALQRELLGLPSLEADLQRFAKGARPGPFLAPYTQWDWFKLAFLLGTARLSLGPRLPRYETSL